MKKSHIERFKVQHIPSLLKATCKAWNADNPWQLSASVAYYAVLSLPALLVIIVNIVGGIWGVEIVQGRMAEQFSDLIGFNA